MALIKNIKILDSKLRLTHAKRTAISTAANAERCSDWSETGPLRAVLSRPIALIGQRQVHYVQFKAYFTTWSTTSSGEPCRGPKFQQQRNHQVYYEVTTSVQTVSRIYRGSKLDVWHGM